MLVGSNPDCDTVACVGRREAVWPKKALDAATVADSTVRFVYLSVSPQSSAVHRSTVSNGEQRGQMAVNGTKTEGGRRDSSTEQGGGL